MSGFSGQSGYSGTSGYSGVATSGFSGFSGISGFSGSGGGVGSTVQIEYLTTISTNYSVTSGANAIGIGPITVASGVSVTVPSGSNWTVLKSTALAALY